MAQISPIRNLNETDYLLDATKHLLGESFLLNGTWPVPVILGVYVTFIAVDSFILTKRKPADPKLLMLMYNVFQIFYNIHMFRQCIEPDAIEYYTKYSCHPMDPSKNLLLGKGINAAFLFFVSKLIDLLDTFFIVLRKKQDQISFLHLYHHIGMVLFSWIMLTNYMGEQLIVIVAANSFVHIVMYVYYTLSLLGPSIQKYLWWKKYVTGLQMSQFLFFVIYMAYLLLSGCSQPKGVSFFVLIQGMIFFSLFKHFYDGKYKNVKAVEPKAKSSTKKQN